MKKIWLILSVVIFTPATILVTNGIFTKIRLKNPFKEVWNFILTTRPEPSGYYTHIMVDLTATVESRLSSPWDNFWKENLGFEGIMQNIHDDLCRIANQKIFINKEDLVKIKLITEKTAHWVQKFSEISHTPPAKELQMIEELKNLQKNF
jgi:hypothetical protein